MTCNCNPCTCKHCQCGAQATILKTLGNESRLQAVLALKDKPLTQQELQEVTSLEQSALSHSLKQLETCGVVQATRRGKYKQYHLNKDFINPLWKLINTHATNHPELKKRCACQ